jgi:quinol-cytochrome oxidoreductase complex cytochrome b subunit
MEDYKMERIIKVIKQRGMITFIVFISTAMSILLGWLGYHNPPPNEKAYFCIVFVAGFCGGMAYTYLSNICVQIVKNIVNKLKHKKSVMKQVEL